MTNGKIAFETMSTGIRLDLQEQLGKLHRRDLRDAELAAATIAGLDGTSTAADPYPETGDDTGLKLMGVDDKIPKNIADFVVQAEEKELLQFVKEALQKVYFSEEDKSSKKARLLALLGRFPNKRVSFEMMANDTEIWRGSVLANCSFILKKQSILRWLSSELYSDIAKFNRDRMVASHPDWILIIDSNDDGLMLYVASKEIIQEQTLKKGKKRKAGKGISFYGN